MNFKKIATLVFASALLFNISCNNDDDPIVNQPKGAYENGILVVNEGSFTSPTGEISFINNDFSSIENSIFKKNNNDELLGSVIQTIGFQGDNAYLVSNVPNKIEIVNRYTFKKVATVTNNLDNPRYIAFSGNQYYVTNNNFFDVMKLNVYNSDNTFVKSINFDNAAEKVVEANGNIVVQTDGVTYDSDYNELPTGYTISIVKPSTNEVSKVVTLPENGIIRDLISYNGDAYALASDNTNSYIYKINSSTGAFSTTTLSGIPQVQKLRIDGASYYFADNGNNIYAMTIGSSSVPTSPIVTAPGYLYGFNVIDGIIYTSDANFTGSSKIYAYSTTNGSLIKSFDAGIGTNGFYKN